MTELRGRAFNRLRAVAIAQLMMLASLNTGYYLTQKSRLAVNCHRFAQKKKAEREEIKNEINKT